MGEMQDTIHMEAKFLWSCEPVKPGKLRASKTQSNTRSDTQPLPKGETGGEDGGDIPSKREISSGKPHGIRRLKDPLLWFDAPLSRPTAVEVSPPCLEVGGPMALLS